MRDRMAKIAEGDYNVLTQEQMNEALKQYGYPANAILSPSLAATLAKSVQARVLVSSSMSKAGGAQYAVQARLAGVNDEAGSVASVQQGGASLTDLGGRVADQLQPAYKSLTDAKACIDQRSSCTQATASRSSAWGRSPSPRRTPKRRSSTSRPLPRPIR
jgi:hypothetical protein